MDQKVVEEPVPPVNMMIEFHPPTKALPRSQIRITTKAGFYYKIEKKTHALSLPEDWSASFMEGIIVQVAGVAMYVVDEFRAQADLNIIKDKVKKEGKWDIKLKLGHRVVINGLTLALVADQTVTIPGQCHIKLPAGTKLQPVEYPNQRLVLVEEAEAFLLRIE